jgi:hypothetical protein
MSVPLDRLYHYLANIVNHDLVIYRWAPHGSRKLEDLIPLSWFSVAENLNNPTMICHDQEPLVWNFYTKQEIKDQTKKNCLQESATQDLKKYNLDWLCYDSILEYTSSYYLRSLTTFVNQYDLTLLLHSEQNSTQVDIFAQNGFVPVYYWSHAVIAQDWFRYAELDPTLTFDVGKIQKDFLIYNRAWSGTREYRLFFAELLIENNLIDCSNTSFSTQDNDLDYRQYQFANKNLQISNHELHKYFRPNVASSASSADYDNTDYSQTGIEIVLETLFDDTRWHLTEKSLRPIACGKPFMLAATPGSLQYLRHYGFETFSGLIDESYDLIVEPHLRLQAIVKEMQRISQLSSTEKCKLYTDLDIICQRNKQHFFNGFVDQVIEEYKTNLDHAMQIMQQNCTGKHFAEIKRLLKNN